MLHPPKDFDPFYIKSRRYTYIIWVNGEAHLVGPIDSLDDVLLCVQEKLTQLFEYKKLNNSILQKEYTKAKRVVKKQIERQAFDLQNEFKARVEAANSSNVKMKRCFAPNGTDLVLRRRFISCNYMRKHRYNLPQLSFEDYVENYMGKVGRPKKGEIK